MRHFFLFMLPVLLLSGCTNNFNRRKTTKTICNPVNISYRFQPDGPSRREAADPTVIFFHNKYFLFASKSGGYWHSDDLADWKFIRTDQIPTEEYAPTVVAIHDTLYFLASSTTKSTLYKSADPLSGKWDVAKDSMDITVWDPALFLDDDQRLYLYWGCSDKNPIYGVELEYADNFKPVGEPVALLYGTPEKHGWEVPGDYNETYANAPWIEGAWMNKHDSIYYLQYAGPGTEFKSYSDGVYTSRNPLGPFEVAPLNPFSYKPEGFAAGAGHGSTFKDVFGNYWHIATSTISVKHMFERRLGLYPAFFDNEGVLHTNTQFGDYPIIIPHEKIEDGNDIFPGWMLLSYHKQTVVSSSLEAHPPSAMTDENIRTWWSAESGNKGEWASLDLGDKYKVRAVQVNFADQDTRLFGRTDSLYYRYIVEASSDNKTWTMMADNSTNTDDRSHAYTQLKKPSRCRYVRITNLGVPGGKFALSGFRVFGDGEGPKPAAVHNVTVSRGPQNMRTARLSWDKVKNATGYNISYGTDKNKLYLNYTVYADTAATINSLDVDKSYFFAIKSFNENGVSN